MEDSCPPTPLHVLSGRDSKSPLQVAISSPESDRMKSPSDRLSPDSRCVICLGRLMNKSFTDSCLHQFCFQCLLQWSKVCNQLRLLIIFFPYNKILLMILLFFFCCRLNLNVRFVSNHLNLLYITFDQMKNMTNIISSEGSLLFHSCIHLILIYIGYHLVIDIGMSNWKI